MRSLKQMRMSWRFLDRIRRRCKGIVDVSVSAERYSLTIPIVEARRRAVIDDS